LKLSQPCGQGLFICASSGAEILPKPAESAGEGGLKFKISTPQQSNTLQECLNTETSSAVEGHFSRGSDKIKLTNKKTKEEKYEKHIRQNSCFMAER
jgi:hypothetical protein